MKTRGIGEVAAHLGIDADTLRWFERRGVVPQSGRDAGGRRRYTEADVHLLQVLLHLRETGMPLMQVAEFTVWAARDPDGVAERLALLSEHRKHVVAQRRRVDRSLSVIEQKIADFVDRNVPAVPNRGSR